MCSELLDGNILKQIKISKIVRNLKNKKCPNAAMVPEGNKIGMS